MMYSEKFAVAVKSNGKVLREFGDKVFIPFGTEYSLYLKNMNSVRAQVGVSIDGKDVLGGSKLVVNANGSIDLERFLEDNNQGHKFKFIERTAGIEQHRGIEAEDGLIRVEIKYEQVMPTFYGNSVFTNRYDSIGTPYRGLYNMSSISGSLGGVTHDSYSATATSMSMQYDSAPVNDVGITGKGEISNQKFQEIAGFITESKTHVIILQMLGETNGTPIVKPINVKTKQECDLCGCKNKAGSKFCSSCGNSLIIL